MSSKATFELYEDSAGQWRWRLVHDNGRIIADSGEGYASKQKATEGLESVRENATGADVVTVEG
nr:HVO_2922 family protein [Halobaculum sp. XH14]